MAPRIIKAFTGNPWEGIEMPEGFNPDGNKFLNPEIEIKEGIEAVVKIIEEIRATKDFDGKLLVSSYMGGPEGRVKKFDVANNSWFGYLLSAIGRTEEAKEIVGDIKSLPLYNGDGTVIDSCLRSRALSSHMSSILNSMWGLLLNAVGYEDEARKVPDSIMKKTDLYRSEDGLVYRQDRQATDMVGTYSNCLWGLLLNAVGYEDEAKKVIDSIKSSNLYRSDGLVLDDIHKVNLRKEKKNARDDIYLHRNAMWGLLLHAVGYKDEAKQVVAAIDGLNMQRSGLMDNARGTGVAVTIDAGINSTWGMLLRAVGYGTRASELKQAIIGSELYDGGGLVVDLGTKVRGLSTNCQWGLFLHNDGYKVFTGEK